MKSAAKLLVTGALVLFPALAGEMTKVQVKVINLDGKPVDRASVVVNWNQGRSPVKFGKKVIKHWELKTNQDGVARMPELPKGKFLVQVIARGYQTFGGSFDVDEDERTLEVKLNPPQPQYSAH